MGGYYLYNWLTRIHIKTLISRYNVYLMVRQQLIFIEVFLQLYTKNGRYFIAPANVLFQ